MYKWLVFFFAGFFNIDIFSFIPGLYSFYSSKVPFM